MRRSKHSLSHYTLCTGDMGRLIPVGHYEVLPGDTVQQASSILLRMSPQMAPVMHPIQVRIHHWFVPYRILAGPNAPWEDFITGVSETFPFQFDATQPRQPNGLCDYLGIPPNASAPPGTLISSAPMSAYLKIWNEFYRDQDLQEEVSWQNDPLWYDQVRHVSWQKDYFTTARPWSQKGPEITIPLGTVAPVIPSTSGDQWPTWVTDDATVGNQRFQSDGADRGVSVNNAPSTTQGWRWQSSGLEADLSVASAANINDVRKAFALQRYAEARAQYGSRYTEYLRYLGVRSSDARLQRPEYCGGGKSTVAFSEVLRTGNESAATTAPIGEMSGHGIAALRTRRFRRFFEEHGIVMSLLSVVPKAIYADGMNRSWFRATKEDFWQKELELIGQQQILNHEVFAGTQGYFGYQDRYAEYRHEPSRVTSEFRDTLNYWHLARIFAQAPALNEDFIACDPGKRIFAEQTQHSMWSMVNHNIRARRLVGKRTIGRII